MLSEAKHLCAASRPFALLRVTTAPSGYPFPIRRQIPLNSTNRLRNVVPPTFFTA
jgi:hypothetical protein